MPHVTTALLEVIAPSALLGQHSALLLNPWRALKGLALCASMPGFA